MHEDFSKYRISNNREFFNIDLQRVVEKMFQIKQNDILKEKIISKEKESILDFTQNIKSDCLKETLIEKSKVDEITTKHKFDKYGYNKEGFHKDGFHKDTKNKYNRFGYDIDGYNRNGFNKKGYHKETGTFYNLKGYDMNGHQKEGIQKKSNKLKQNNKSVRLYNEKANEHFKKYF